MLRAARLLVEFGMRDTTTATKGSNFRCFVEYGGNAEYAPLPATEGHLLGYIGWMSEQRERKLRSVSHKSLPGYISALRTTYQQVLGEKLPLFPMGRHAINAYQWWEETAFPVPGRRMGLAANVLKQIFTLGMTSLDVAIVRDTTMVLFSYILSGFHESSVVSLETANVEPGVDFVRARLNFVKGRPASLEQPVGWTGDRDSPLALVRQWASMRCSHGRFVALPSETTHWHPAFLSSGLSRCLEAVQHNAPAGCHYGAHSLRTGALTVQVLLGIQLEARLALFGWGQRSEATTRLYFDLTMRWCPAGTWFFGRLS
jgi:hypothetical protein